MIELILATCLLDEPTACKEVSLIYSVESVTLMQCMMGAQPEIARWSEAHPKWRVTRWSCAMAGQIAKA
jgi:hypothetical protein